MQLLEVKTFTVLPNPNLASGSLDHWAQWCQMTHRWTTMNDFCRDSNDSLLEYNEIV